MSDFTDNDGNDNTDGQINGASTRYLIDYAGGGSYQALAIIDGEAPQLFASSQNPTALLNFVMQKAVPGEQVCIAPAVAAIQALCNPVPLNTMLQRAKADPFVHAGSVIRVPSADEQAALIDALKQVVKQVVKQARKKDAERAATDGSDSAAAEEGSGDAADDGQADDPPSRIAPKFEKKQKRGGRIGWLFEMTGDCPTQKDPNPGKQGGDERTLPEDN
ncbi:MAG: hypothetical protein RIT24_2041 [Planctomycetota bacterium]